MQGILIFTSVKDDIKLEVFKSNHMQTHKKEYWRRSGRFTIEQSTKIRKTICSTKEKYLITNRTPTFALEVHCKLSGNFLRGGWRVLDKWNKVYLQNKPF